MDVEVIIKREQENGEMLLEGETIKNVKTPDLFFSEVRKILNVIMLQHHITEPLYFSRYIVDVESENWYENDDPDSPLNTYGCIYQNKDHTIQVILTPTGKWALAELGNFVYTRKLDADQPYV